MSLFAPHSPRSVSLRMIAGAKNSSALSGVAAVSELSVAIRELLGHLQTLAASSVSRGDVFKGLVGDINALYMSNVLHTIQGNYAAAEDDIVRVHGKLVELAVYLRTDDGVKIPNSSLIFGKIDQYFADHPEIAKSLAQEEERDRPVATLTK